MHAAAIFAGSMVAPLDPLDQTLAACYRDARGSERIEIHNDGQRLRTVIRGVPIAGSDFDDLSVESAHRAAAASLFTLYGDEVCACQLEVTFPIEVVVAGAPIAATLVAELELGAPNPERPGISRETLTLALRLPTGELRSSGRTGWFEDELLDLWRQLDGGHLRACICCAFSDYSPYGHGLFGALACFRDAKDAYRRVSTKQALFDLWPRLSGFVQETHLCPQFELRRPGSGYRG
ncbi:MAG: DUF6304 family protein [Polyangiaceae bacterium]